MSGMTRFGFNVFVGLLSVAVLLAAPWAVGAQVVVVTAKSVDGLLSDFTYLAPLVGQDELAKQVTAFLKDKTGEGGLAGLDTKRPLGAYLKWPNAVTDLASLDVPVVFFVPVTGEKAFLDLLQRLDCKPQKADADTHRV